MTVPFDRVPLSEHAPLYRELEELGYTDAWSSEADGSDAFTPLALAAAWAPGLRLGTAIVPTFTRGPALMAQSAAALADAAPGRVAIGVGTSSDVIVERWNGLEFDRPYQRTRDMVRFMRSAMSGDKVDFDGEFKVRGFRLGRPPAIPPQILVAALRPGMLKMAGRESDGAIINWLGADDVPQVVSEVGEGKEIVARIFVCPSTDAQTVRDQARRLIAAYLNVPVYAAFHDWLGRGPVLQPMWDAWQAGDRKAALAAIPDDLVDTLVLHGSPSEVKARIRQYMDNGVTTPALAVVPFGGLDVRQAVRDLAPEQ